MAETTQTVEEKTDEQQDQQNQVEQEDSKAQAQSVELSQAPDDKTTGPGTSIDILLDMDVPVVVTIGQTEVPIQRLLQLGPGSVLKLDKSVDAPVDLYLRDTKFATGSIVVVEDRFAVRIKEILGTGTPANLKKE
ncbi:MAG: FliM/FliN family flagellar motor switch protein [Planctomycetota bacterium]|jgi:flagellar motor switch protein FliN/FliY